MRQGRQGTADDEPAGIFDLIAATVAVQAAQTVQTVQAGHGEMLAAQFAATSNPQTTPVRSERIVAAASPDFAPSTSELPDSAAPRSAGALQSPENASETTSMSHGRHKFDPSAYTAHHSTLPVMVAGQLVELTLLRERKPSREAGPTRRLSIVLEAPAAGSVTVDAHLENDTLVISLESAMDPDLETQNQYAQEVTALAHRLGWAFTDTQWEISR